MNSLYILLFLLAVFSVGSIQNVQGGGSESEESEALLINGSYHKIILETSPSVLHVDTNKVDFNVTTVNDDTQQIVTNVQYKIQVFDNAQNLILDFNAYSPDEKLTTTVEPNPDVNFLGKMTNDGIWIGSVASPLIIEAPLFLEGGLVDVRITIISIDSQPVSSSDGDTFKVLLTMGQFIPFTVEIDDTTFDLMFATYFDRIKQFDYNPANKKIVALMPFNWDRTFIESVPFVHAEYYIPKSIDIFNNHEIILTVNDIAYFGTIDRSGDDEIVVHFLLSSSKLLKLLEDIPLDQHDKMVFGIQSGKIRDVEKEDALLENGDRIVVLSTQEDWKFYLSLTPAGKINPGNTVDLNLEFRDPVTNTVIPQITYDADVFLNGKVIESTRGLETPNGLDTIKINFAEIGAAIVRISNVNNFDTSGEFSFRVSEPVKNFTGNHFVDVMGGSSHPGCETNNLCYVEPSLMIGPNETVVWNNKDAVAHTATSGAPGTGYSGVFDSGIIGAGSKFSFEFESQGVFEYYCTLHPWMRGTVTVDNDSGPVVPEWFKDNAAWWSDGRLSDADFVNGLEFLISQDVIDVPKDISISETSGEAIPDWLRTNTAWWSDGILSDSEFLKGVEWLIANGMINV